MDQPMPEWLCNDFFTQCLQKEKGNPNITVTNFTTSSAAPPGNNYGSFITRVKVEYKEGQDSPELHSLSLIIKAELTHGPIKDLSNELQQNEPLFYGSFIPEVKKITDIRIFPKSLFSPRPNVIILEDLKEQGFVMADRTKQLDFNHCRQYMIASATFHAVSVAVYNKHPELFEPIKNVNLYSVDSKMKEPIELMTKGAMTCLAHATEKIERLNKYSRIIRQLIPQVWDLMVEANKPSSHIVNTIRQGDPWVSNMMFKYNEEGNVCDIRLLDFQGISYGSPVNDLVFFIWSSANNDVKAHKLEELYRIYIDTFNEKLKQFNCTERITYQQVMNEMKRMSPLILFSAGNIPVLLDPEPIDMAAMFESGDPVQVENCFKKYYNDNYCNNYLLHLLEILERNGVFDDLKKYNQ